MIKQKIFALLLTVVMIVSIFAPLTAFAEGADGLFGDSGGTASQSTSDATPETDSGTIGTTGTTLGESIVTPGETCLPDDEACATPTTAADGGMVTLSGWEGGGTEFYTRIRLTARDWNGNPISGAVYGLYRTSDDSLVEYLTTDSYGVAESGDVPVDTDYYLQEYSTPTGYQPNPERKDIRLTEICAPSRVDENVTYDPILGRIKVIKTDESGNLLPGVGFYVYNANSWSIVDTITTDENGEAVTIELPYGAYELYEYDPPEGFSGGGYTSVNISNHEETVEVNITNYLARGYAYIYKIGNDGRKIQGAVFSLYKADGDEWIEDITTNSSGYAYTSNLLLGDYYLIEKSAPAPYAADTTTKHTFTISYSGQSVSFNIENHVAGSPGKLKIIKADDSANPLSGVVFGLYRAWDNMKLGELTTGADGTVTSSDLIPGDYYIVELTGKTGYTMYSGQIPFTIDGSGVTVEKTVENPKIRIFGKVQVIKKDDAGMPLAGVRFGVYCHLDNLLEELVTGSDGTATSGVLNEGTGYYLRELEGLPGYLSDTETKYPFDIATNNVIIPVNITNPRITGAVKVIKTGEDEETPLPGVVFGVFRANTDDKVCELTTGTNGTAQSGTLFYDNYELRELSTVDGYELIATPIPFSISEQDVVVEIPVTNPLIFGSVKVVKVDGEPEAQPSLAGVSPLPGAVFGLYNRLGQKLAELTTDENGEAVRGGLPKGEYNLKELAAPEGFVLPDDMIPFAISEQGQVVELVVPNTQGFGTFKLIKYGEDEELLPGVVFEVYRAATNAKVDEITTDEHGEASIELPLARYYLKETATAEGYKLLSGTVSFTLTADGATVELSLQNQKTPVVEDGKIRIIKKSEKDSTPLKDAVFGVYRTFDDEKVAELKTGADGTAFSPALPEGSYYLKELVAPDNFDLSIEKHSVTVKKGETAEATLTNKPLPEPCDQGVIKLVKKDSETNKLLPGVKFGIFKASGDTKVGELVTESDGTAVSAPLPIGDYYLLELAALDGYELRTDKIAVTVKKAETITVTVTNTPTTVTPTTGMVTVVKKAHGTGKKLSGAVFGLFKSSNDEKMAELTTGSDGTATSNALPEADYYLREIKAPSGFRLSTDKVAVHVKAGQTVEVTVTNYPEDAPQPTAKVKVVKKSGTGEKLPGAVFGVYKQTNDEKVCELNTGSDGTAISPALPAGDYYLKELKCPTGFKLVTDRTTFALKDGDTKEITVVNEKLSEDSDTGTLLITKKAERTGKLLADAVFGVYTASSNKKVVELTTMSDGTAFTTLEPGDYYLVELRAPASYVAETAKIPFAVRKDATVRIEITNTQGRGTAKLIKTDDSGKTLSGGVFALCRQDGTQIAELTSGKDGTASYELPIGAYYLVEKTAPSGFKLSAQQYSFTIENGKTTEVKVKNEPLTGTVEVYFKHIKDGRELLEKVVFTAPVGTDYIKWMRDNGYENRQIDGYTLIRTDYPSSFVLIDGKLVVTLWYDDPAGTINVPKTGETPPYASYAFALLSWSVAGICGTLLWRMRKRAKSQVV